MINENSYKLAIKQALPLNIKIKMTETRIREWYEEYNGKVYVAFSGGKDSTVLLHIVRKMYPDVPAVFCDTGLEYPEIRSFVKKFDNVEWIKPKLTFTEVLKKYGFPVVSKEVSQKIYECRTTKSDKLRQKRLHGDNNKYKSGKIPEKWKALLNSEFKVGHQCCDVMKKRPSKAYEKKTGRVPYTGVMAGESHFRRQSYIRSGCNSYNTKRPQSKPLSIWTEDNIWEYIKSQEIEVSEVYKMGFDRTGCMFCMFGVHLEKGENRFQRMKRTHPAQYNYCMNKLGCGKVLDFIGVEH